MLNWPCSTDLRTTKHVVLLLNLHPVHTKNGAVQSLDSVLKANEYEGILFALDVLLL